MIRPGRAEPALHRAASTNACCTSLGAPERGDALDGDDRLADCAGSEHEAAAHQLAVDQHAARSALALLARALAAHQPEPLAQHEQQALAHPRVADLGASHR